MILLLIVSMFFISVEHYQNQLLKCKDSRMGIVNEVLNSMRVIKYYAWERKFAAKINRARHIEVDCLRAYTVTNAALYAFWEVVPAIVGATAFILHTYYLGTLNESLFIDVISSEIILLFQGSRYLLQQVLQRSRFLICCVSHWMYSRKC